MVKRLILIHFLLLLVNNVFGINDKIFSTGNCSVETLSNFLSYGNRELGKELTMEFAQIYYEEAKKEGINWDIAFVQMCLETGFLTYGTLVEGSQNNFCGLGSYDGKEGARFSTIREGVRAHVQHLKAYATEEELIGVLIDPRFHLVARGSATDVNQLAGKWAEDPNYGLKLTSLLTRINILNSEDVILRAEIPLISNNQNIDESEYHNFSTLQEVVTIKEKEEEGSGWLR